MKKVFLIVLISFLTIFAQDSMQTFLSLSGTGVQKFINEHPDYDGRGTIVFVLDTGVDMGIDGLTKTSTGAVKVIDVQDFSHEGDIQLYDCESDEQDGKSYFINEDKNYKVAGADKLSLKPVDDKYYIGVLEETHFKNSSSNSEDLNGNNSTDDKYYMVAFQTKSGDETYWVVYFDTNDNGDLSDEKPIRNYREKFDSFVIPNKKGLPVFTFALNIFPDKKLVSLHYDDGAHGTHVSGIATGYHIGGTYLNGVAPGANVISLKIGNNNFSGGATVTESMKNAFLYADKISKEKKEPCILNMSFGIGSEIEGKSDMEQFLDKLLKENPYLYVCVSNGNDGPGISTAGLPASSDYVFSSGAVLPTEVGRDLYGTSLNKDIILYFSSRGGEVSKPDICSPGACASTIPNWEGFDRMWGTSMASPYTAGVVSLLLSSMEKEHSGVKIPSQLVFKAIRNSATKMEGYTPLDEGGGYINVINAHQLLNKYIAQGELNNFETYSISSIAPNMPDGRADNLYIRDGIYLSNEHTYAFSIKRNNIQKKDKFYRIYKISSNSDWITPIQKRIHLRNDQAASVSVKIDKSKLSKPGLYVSKISANRDDKSDINEFNMLATVIIPYQFDYSNNYSLNINEENIEPGMIKRYFLELPAGQTAMRVALTSLDKKYAQCRFRLFKPNGEEQYLSYLLNTKTQDNNIENTFYNLVPGVYELDIEGYFLSDQTSNYKVDVNFYGINNIGKDELNESNKTLNIINEFNNAEAYNLSGKILGYETSEKVVIKAGDQYSFPFVLYKNESSKEFNVSLSKEDFNKVTDFSVLIYNEDGKAIEKTGLGYKDGSLTIENTFKTDTVNLKLLLVPGFANGDSQLEANITTKTYMKIPTEFSIKDNSRSTSVLYPSIQKELTCDFQKPDYVMPNNAKVFGKIYFESRSTKKIDSEMPIHFNF